MGRTSLFSHGRPGGGWHTSPPRGVVPRGVTLDATDVTRTPSLGDVHVADGSDAEHIADAPFPERGPRVVRA